MLILSRRTIAMLAAFFGLLGVLGFAGQGRAATDNNNVVQALRAGGIVIVSATARPSRIRRTPIHSTSTTSRPSEISTTRARPWQKLSATPYVSPGFRSERSIPASTTEHTKPRSSRASRISRRPQILPRVVSWCRRMRITAASKLFTSCSPPHRCLAPTRFSLRTSRTLSMLSVRIGLTSKRARPRCSAPRAVAISSSPACRWKNGLMSPQPRSEESLGLLNCAAAFAAVAAPRVSSPLVENEH